MNVAIHQLISERLDQLESRGLVSEYLIGWKGQAGRLDPNVTVWAANDRSDELLAGELRWLVGDLVRSSDLTILQSAIDQPRASATAR